MIKNLMLTIKISKKICLILWINLMLIQKKEYIIKWINIFKIKLIISKIKLIVFKIKEIIITNKIMSILKRCFILKKNIIQKIFLRILIIIIRNTVKKKNKYKIILNQSIMNKKLKLINSSMIQKNSLKKTMIFS